MRTVLLAAVLAAAPARAGTYLSPINGRTLDLDAPAEYSFLLIGHAYGAHNRSVFPAASLLAGVERINAMRPRFIVLLGDMLQRVRPPDIEAFKYGFADRIEAPIFNAVGNHEAGDRALYGREFGHRAYFGFRHGSEEFVFLDSELADGRVEGPQAAFLSGRITAAARSPSVRNLFIFSHRLIWAIGNPRFEAVIPRVNEPYAHRPAADGFAETFLPRLRALKGAAVFLAAGDIGGRSGSPGLLFDRDPGGSPTFVATGLGDTESDAIVRVSVSGRGSAVRFEAIPLAAPGAKAFPLDAHGIESWEE